MYHDQWSERTIIYRTSSINHLYRKWSSLDHTRYILGYTDADGCNWYPRLPRNYLKWNDWDLILEWLTDHWPEAYSFIIYEKTIF